MKIRKWLEIALFGIAVSTAAACNEATHTGETIEAPTEKDQSAGKAGLEDTAEGDTWKDPEPIEEADEGEKAEQDEKEDFDLAEACEEKGGHLSLKGECEICEKGSYWDGEQCTVTDSDDDLDQDITSDDDELLKGGIKTFADLIKELGEGSDDGFDDDGGFDDGGFDGGGGCN